MVALLVVLLSASFITPTQAAPKSSLVSAAFKTLLNTTTDSIDALDQKYQADVYILDEALSAATKTANAVLAQEIQAATDLYSRWIVSVNQRLEPQIHFFRLHDCNVGEDDKLQMVGQIFETYHAHI